MLLSQFSSIFQQYTPLRLNKIKGMFPIPFANPGTWTEGSSCHEDLMNIFYVPWWDPKQILMTCLLQGRFQLSKNSIVIRLHSFEFIRIVRRNSEVSNCNYSTSSLLTRRHLIRDLLELFHCCKSPQCYGSIISNYLIMATYWRSFFLRISLRARLVFNGFF